MTITSPEVLTDNGVTKEFDPLRNSKDEPTKTPLATQQTKCKSYLMFIYINLPSLT